MSVLQQNERGGQPDPLTCLFRGHDDDCRWPSCPDHVPAVEGDWKRSRPTCARAMVAVAELRGGLSQDDVGWLLGVSRQRVHQIEHAALAKLRREVRP